MAITDRTPRSRPRTAIVRNALFDRLDDRIAAGMERYGIPGAAVAVYWDGVEYVKGYGVTNLDDPTPVDGDTLFRIGSTTKTITGTVVMRLVEQGKLDLDLPVRTYLPALRTSLESVAQRATVRHLLNHTAGWLGDLFEDTGGGEDALSRYVAEIERLPQLTPLGSTFHYNNAAIVLAGHLIEVVTGMPYAQAVHDLLLKPLGLAHSRFSGQDTDGLTVSASHRLDQGGPVVDPFVLPHSTDPAGGLLSSARDQLRYARFHLGDGTAPDGGRLLTQQSLTQMRANHGRGGTVMVELDGMGVSWMLRPSAEGVRIVQHGGNVPGEHSGFIMVPERDFALTVLTNSDGGPRLASDLVVDDWALKLFAGVSNLAASPARLSEPRLAPYTGRYIQRVVDLKGEFQTTVSEIWADEGQLCMTVNSPLGTNEYRLAFYRPDYVLVLDERGEPDGSRADFIRDDEGGIAWLRMHGRLNQHIGE